MSDDIVTRLRFLLGKCNTAPAMAVWSRELREAADEIERLRRNTGCARDQRSTQFCHEALDAQRDSKQLRKERDEARRMVCSAYALQGRDIATERGWDCLKDGWDRGADDQIPEAL